MDDLLILASELVKDGNYKKNNYEEHKPDGDYNVIITIIDKITATGVLNFSDVTWSSGHASVKVSKRETNDKQIHKISKVHR